MHGYGGLTTGDEHTGNLERLSPITALPRDAGMNDAHLARLALDRIAQDHGRQTGIPRDLGRGFQRLLRCRDNYVDHIGKARIARLWRLRDRVIEMPGDSR